MSERGYERDEESAARRRRAYTLYHHGGPIRITERELVTDYLWLRDELRHQDQRRSRWQLEAIEALEALREVEGHARRLAMLMHDADVAVSTAHDAIYAEPYDKQAASEAIWAVHALLRPDAHPHQIVADNVSDRSTA